MRYEESNTPEHPQSFHDFAHPVRGGQIIFRLNNGHYIDAQATLTDVNLRVTGQKDVTNNRAHLWVQNIRHSWKNVVDNISNLSGLSGTVTLSGFTPNLPLNVEWYAFTTKGMPAILHSSATTDSQGKIVLAFPTDRQITDVGIKIGDYPHPIIP
jgi:hypothetical protein